MTQSPSVPAPAMVRPRFFGWWSDGTPDAKRALIAAALGWMLDAFDVMLYALVLTPIMADLGMSRQTAGAIGSVTLLASAAGGLFFGVVADRYGRTRALMASVLIYSVFTAACGLATDGRCSSRSSAFCSASAWAASGRVARRSCPRRGRPSIAARRSG